VLGIWGKSTRKPGEVSAQGDAGAWLRRYGIDDVIVGELAAWRELFGASSAEVLNRCRGLTHAYPGGWAFKGQEGAAEGTASQHVGE